MKHTSKAHLLLFLVVNRRKYRTEDIGEYYRGPLRARFRYASDGLPIRCGKISRGTLERRRETQTKRSSRADLRKRNRKISGAVSPLGN